MEGADNFCRDLADVRPLIKRKKLTKIKDKCGKFIEPPLSRTSPRSRGATLRLGCLISDLIKSPSTIKHLLNTSVDVFSELSPPELFF